MKAVSDACTIVFDKTGTSTYASPKVARIAPFAGKSEYEMLRLVACLEERYPYSKAKAVVAQTTRRNLHQEERRSKMEYVVAHGIFSTVDGEQVVIESCDFV